MQSLTENGKLAVPETGQKAAGLGLSVRSRTLIQLLGYMRMWIAFRSEVVRAKLDRCQGVDGVGRGWNERWLRLGSI